MFSRVSVLAAVAASLVLGTAPAAARTTTEWSAVPASDGGPDGRISLRHTLDPGASVTDGIAVTNRGSAPARFTVTAGDGVLGRNGAFDIAAGEPTGSGGWITVAGLDSGGITVAGGESKVLPVTIAVPADAVPGDHPAGVAVGVSADEGGVAVRRRIGVRVHLRVAGEVEPALAVREVGSSYSSSWLPFAPGTLRVDYVVANTGDVRLGAATTVDVAGPFDLAPTSAADGVDELLPGDSAARSVRVAVSPLFVLFGDVSVAATAVGADQVALPGATASSFSSGAIPWAELALVVLLVGGGALVVVRRRRTTADGGQSRADAAAASATR
ncbi:COG1361 family protein [Actinokineospora pegani]|uniref:hypothetical protein n=1 Tax=Actinokineospora pegani TaxID=2654637 RepID=UPI0012EABD33|nr:hypothetical protein [Actinokineospora pegani]